MNEISYSAALELGIEPMHYRTDALDGIGAGDHPCVLDALVWSKRKPCLFALVTMSDGVKLQVIAFQKHNRPELGPYLGMREFAPGEHLILKVDVGARGGMRPALVRPEMGGAAVGAEHGEPHGS